MLIIFGTIFMVASCNRENKKVINTASIQLPFNFTFYGILPVGSGIKEIHDTLGVMTRYFYFDTEDRLTKLIEHHTTIPYQQYDSVYSDTSIVYDHIVYNSNNQILQIGNSIITDAYTFEYNGSYLSKVTEKSPVIFTKDVSRAPRIDVLDFSTDNNGKRLFATKSGNYSCTRKENYFYTQDALDSITSTSITCSSNISFSTFYFTYTDGKINNYHISNSLSGYIRDYQLKYSDNKLIRIEPMSNAIVDAPSTTFIYY